MAYLIYGEDTYRSQAKLKAIKDKYINASLGDTNLAIVDGAVAKAEEIIRQIWAMPFLAPKRLVIVKNLLTQGKKDAQEEIIGFLPKVPATTVLMFFEEGAPDKRTGLFKALNKAKLAEEFAPLEPLALKKWIEKKLQEVGVIAEPGVTEFLIKSVGNDLWRQEQEINKLILHADEKITLQDAQELVYMNPEGDTFQLLDALATRDAAVAYRHLKARLALGDAPIYLLGMMVYGFRTLLIIQDLLREQPGRNGAPGIHPFVWRKSVNQLKRFSAKELREIYRLLRDVDYECKTGIMEATAALDYLVAELCLRTSKEGRDVQMGAYKRAH